MKRTAAACATLLLLASCISGPSYLSNSVGDWRNNKYKDSPFATAIVTDFLPLVPIVEVLAFVPDFLILNPIQFWGVDVWRGKGAAFKHDNPTGAPKAWFQ